MDTVSVPNYQHSPHDNNGATRYTDEKGRVHVDQLTELELLKEAVQSMRTTQDLIQAFYESMDTHPMFKMFAGKMRG